MWSYNKLAERERAHEHFIHKKKVREIKGKVDNKAPKIVPHLEKKAKKFMNQRLRQSEIQKQNLRLSKKIRKIGSLKIEKKKDKHNSSLNIYNRIEFTRKVFSDNQSILCRIQSVKPHYPVEEYKNDYKKKKILSKQISQNSNRIPLKMNYNSSFDPLGTSHTDRQSKTSRPQSQRYRKSTKQVLNVKY